MDISPLRLVQLLIPRVPLIFKTLVLNKLSLSANSDKQDTQTELFVAVIKSIITAASRPLKVVQDGSVKDTVIKGKMWIAKVGIEASETDVRDLVLQGIQALGDGTEKFELPNVTDISGEWTGYRDCPKNAPRLQISEDEQYKNLMGEVKSGVTVLYFHGGAYFMMDPASHRTITSGLAKKTGGRCFSVRYRLAPQSAFPAQLIDALTAYLYLLAPPDGAFHDAVPADKIVFAGDSAGGNLAAALLLLLITLKRNGVKTVKFHGQEVRLDVPAGMATNSPWTDVSRSLPSVHDNAKYDYLDPPSATGMTSARPIPVDEIWPSKPPRAEVFCTASLLMHPLVSPVLATPKMWEGVPPSFLCCGNEGLEDEIAVTARHLHQAGGTVDFAGYEGMPHCFAMIFPSSIAGKECFNRWAQFIVDAVDKKVEQKSTGQWLKAFSRPAAYREVDLSTMGVSDEEVTRRIQYTKVMATEREIEALRDWDGNVRAKL